MDDGFCPLDIIACKAIRSIAPAAPAGLGGGAAAAEGGIPGILIPAAAAALAYGLPSPYKL